MLIAGVFALGYLMITLEQFVNVNKAATALLLAAILWSVLAVLTPQGIVDVPAVLHQHLAAIAEILFFVLGAMAIVELIDAHDGFQLIATMIQTRHRVVLLWLVSGLGFFLSAVLDNLTTTIVMMSLVRKVVADQHDRWVFAGMVVIAANAGGAWSPIGDVTTTMLWIGNQLSPLPLIKALFLPSLVCLLVPLLWLSVRFRGEVSSAAPGGREHHGESTTRFERSLVLLLGISVLLAVPIFKSLTHLPPYLGMLAGLGILWVVTELLHHNKNEEIRQQFSIAGILQRIDTTSILFFLGILLAVAALDVAGHLSILATWMQREIHNTLVMVTATGLLSAIVDNVPLVAAMTHMFPVLGSGDWMRDGAFWHLLAYGAGTGGSVLIIGSAAGIAAMGMERVPFSWYMKKFSLLALAGYLAGIACFVLIN